jgi:LacI family transcriptional regulator
MQAIDEQDGSTYASNVSPPLSSRTPTISDVAKAARVSRATVSRAFSRPKVLSEATVLHVRTIATTLRYVPNEVARALSTGRYANMVEVLYRISHTKT